ncbi:hypothetical protein ACLMMR_42295, partial [Streptomyces sp. NPDC000405]
SAMRSTGPSRVVESISCRGTAAAAPALSPEIGASPRWPREKATRDEAIAAGWFGPPGACDERVYARLGDVVAAAHDDVLIIASEREPKESAMVGNHGSMTPAEQLVPLLEVRS